MKNIFNRTKLIKGFCLAVLISLFACDEFSDNRHLLTD